MAIDIKQAAILSGLLFIVILVIIRACQLRRTLVTKTDIAGLVLGESLLIFAGGGWSRIWYQSHRCSHGKIG